MGKEVKGKGRVTKRKRKTHTKGSLHMGGGEKAGRRKGPVPRKQAR